MNRSDFEFALSVATFIIASWPLVLWAYNRSRKLDVSISPLSWATLSDPEDIDGYKQAQRFAAMVDLNVRNTMSTGVSLESFHVKYRTQILKFQEWRVWQPFDHLEKYIERFEFLYQWTELQGPMPLSEPASVIGANNTHRKMAHRLVNFIEFNIEGVGNYLQSNEANSGVILFVSEGYFHGGGRPYTRVNGTVPLLCSVYDGRKITSKNVLEIRLVELSLARTSYPPLFLAEEH